VQPSELLLLAVEELSEKSGHRFHISPSPVCNTNLYVVHTEDHPFRPEYTFPLGVLGFRVPFNFPDAAPEDSFFVAPAETQLREPDVVRRSTDLNRAGRADQFVTGSLLGNIPVLVFSWHLWDRMQWNRRKNTLMDHYTHCIRRFEQAEHD
jgi:hypothetical protein